MTKFPSWLEYTIGKVKSASARCLAEKDAIEDTCLQEREKDYFVKDPVVGIRYNSPIDFLELFQDPDYLILNQPILYSTNSAASYYLLHNQPMAWCNNAQCMTHDAYNPVQIAHRSLPFGTVVKITNLSNGNILYGVITDRGPYTDDLRRKDGTPVVERDFDLSKMGMDLLTNGNFRVGIAVPIQVEVIAIPIDDTIVEKQLSEFLRCAAHFLGEPNELKF